MFTSRTHFQSHECKRFLNNEDVDLTLGRPPDREQVAGLLIVAGAGAAKEPVGCKEEELPQSDAEFGAQDEDGGASEPSQPGEDDAASERSQQDGGERGSEPSGVASDPPSMDEHGQPVRKRARAEGQEKTVDADDLVPASVHVFRQTTSLIDDWLHRGPALMDLDLDNYSIEIERVDVRRVKSLHEHQRVIIPFDAHYSLTAEGFAQQKRSRRVIPRIVGPQCKSVGTDNGEDNALYKQLLCTPLRCRGQDQCADPRNFAPLLFPNRATKFCFAPAWKARRAHMEVLADKGEEKLQRAKRIPVLQDNPTMRIVALILKAKRLSSTRSRVSSFNSNPVSIQRKTFYLQPRTK